MDKKNGRWITVKGNHIFIEDGQTVEQAMAAAFNFDNEDEDLNVEVEGSSDFDDDDLVTTQYFLTGFGQVKKAAYENLKSQGRDVFTEIVKTPNDNLPYKRLSKREDMKTAASKTNPLFNTKDYAWTYNCQRCVIALEMRYRGYDVTAKPRLNDDKEFIFKTGSHWSDCFDNFEWEYPGYYKGDSTGSHQLMEEEMVKCGEGARFIVSVVWKGNNGAHVLNAIVKDGDVIYYDGQKGKKYMSWRNHCKYPYTKYARVDHLHMNDNVKNCVYDKGEQPDRYNVNKDEWVRGDDDGYETI